MIDLHVHSRFSDGSYSPRQLVEYALNHNISAFALTDHDTTAGLPEAFAAAEELSGQILPANPAGNVLEVIAGIEFSTEYEGKDIHIVGLDIDYQSKRFAEHIERFVASREARNEKMCALLRGCGIPLTYADLQARFPGAVITRAHYGRFLLEKGYVKSIPEAFDRYIGDHAPCYIPREKVSPTDAISLILSAGGIPILAHPILYRMSDRRLEQLASLLKEAGLVGIEVFYSTYTPAETRQMQGLAKKLGLAASGGSDFHGENKPGLQFGTGYGSLSIPEDVWETLKQAR